MSLDDREKSLVGTMHLACCALHPDCTCKDDCNKIIKKLDAERAGLIMISEGTFDYAKRKWLESLYGNEDDKSSSL